MTIILRLTVHCRDHEVAEKVSSMISLQDIFTTDGVSKLDFEHDAMEHHHDVEPT